MPRRPDVEIKVGGDTKDYKSAVKGLTAELQRGIETAKRLEKEATKGATNASRATLAQQKAVTSLVLTLAEAQRAAANASKEDRKSANAAVKAARIQLRLGRTKLQALRSEEQASKKQLAISRQLARQEARRLRLARQQAKAFSAIPSTFGGLSGVFSTVSAGALSYRLIQTLTRLPGLIREAVDNWKLYSNQLRIVTQNEKELTELRGRLIGLSVETFSQIQGTITTYARLARATKTLSISQKELLDISRAINQAGKIGGATSREALAAQIQFSQALASGRFSGDELRSVFEQLPRLAKAIADGLGVGIGKLRELGEQGKLTSDVLTNSILSQTEKLNQEFADIAPTIEQGFLALSDSVTGFVGKVDTALGLSDKLARSLLGSAELINTLSGNTSDVASASSTAAAEYERLLNRASALREELDKIRSSASVDTSFDPRSLGAGIGFVFSESKELEEDIRRINSELSTVEKELRVIGTDGPEYLKRVLEQTRKIQKAAGAIVLIPEVETDASRKLQERINDELHLLSLRSDGTILAEKEIRLFNRLQQGYSREQAAQAELYEDRITQLRIEAELRRELQFFIPPDLTVNPPDLSDLGLDGIKGILEQIDRDVGASNFGFDSTEFINRRIKLENQLQQELTQIREEAADDQAKFQESILVNSHRIAGELLEEEQEFFNRVQKLRERDEKETLQRIRRTLREQQRIAEKTADIIGQGIENIFIGIAEAQERGISAAKALRGAILRLLGSFAHLGISRLLGASLGSLGSIPGLPGRQFGGPVFSGQPYLVGESGPELFIPDRSGHISPNTAGGVTLQQIIQSTDGPGVSAALRVGEPAIVRAATLLADRNIAINRNRPSPQMF